MRLVCFASVAVLAFVARTAPAEEIPNPEFVSWSKFKPGTSITTKMTSTIGNLSTGATVTVTLLEVGADKLVTEVSGAAKVNDTAGAFPSMKIDITKTATGPNAPKQDGAANGRPAGTFEEGTETLKIAETEIKARWFKFKSESDGVKTEGKVWVSDDVPGSMVKQEMTRVSGAVIATDKLELIEFKKP